jgi:hypothetical protein
MGKYSEVFVAFVILVTKRWLAERIQAADGD